MVYNPSVLSDAGAVSTAAAERTMIAHSGTNVQDIDEARLTEMLTLVGPASEGRLLRSLIDDLRTAQADLEAALSRRDAEMLRAGTHVLASLADTFGAAALSAAAQTLQAQSLGGVHPSEANAVRVETNRLIARLSHRLARVPR